MRIAVYGNTAELAVWQTKNINDGHEIILCNDASSFQITNAEVYFQFSGDGVIVQPSTHTTVFYNAVISTTSTLPQTVIRFNGWPLFFGKDIIEIAGGSEYIHAASTLLHQIGINNSIAPDEPGFIAARIIAMIINEAYFALEDEVSDTNQIDTAMKLGTNYPNGPFEWVAHIGLKNIVALLNELSKTDARYTACSKMLEAVNTI